VLSGSREDVSFEKAECSIASFNSYVDIATDIRIF
jgi:hypothetical protein